MIQHNWTIICARVESDQENETLNLINIISTLIAAEPLYSDKSVTIDLPFVIATQWSRGLKNNPDKGNVRIELVHPDGTAVGGSSFEVDLTLIESFMGEIEVPQIVIRGTGLYQIRVSLEKHDGKRSRWQAVGRIPIRIESSSSVAPAKT